MSQLLRALPLALSLLTAFHPTPASASEGRQATTLSGTITRAENGQPLSGAVVVIDELRLQTRADGNGAYRFENVPPGLYHVGVRADGYSTRRIE